MADYNTDFLALTAQIVSAHVGHNSMTTEALPDLIKSVHAALTNMDSALLVDRLHFAFTITFHYLFPQLTMGLAPLIVIWFGLGLTSKVVNAALVGGFSALGAFLASPRSAVRRVSDVHSDDLGRRPAGRLALRIGDAQPDEYHGTHEEGGPQ